MSVEPAPTRILRALDAILQQFGSRWYLFGAQAVVTWGRPRLTGDVDVTVFLEREGLDPLIAAMESGGFEVRTPRVAEFVERTRVIPLLHIETGMPVDVVLAGSSLEEEFLQRARMVDVGGMRVPVIAPEDLVVTKLLAGRSKDLEDARTVLLAQGSDLDVNRVRAVLHAIETALDRRDLEPQLDALLRAIGRR